MNWISVKDRQKYPTVKDVLMSPKGKGGISNIPILVSDGEDVAMGYFGLVSALIKGELVESVEMFAPIEFGFDTKATKFWMPLPDPPEVEE